jgi:zinc and cadmium transporter
MTALLLSVLTFFSTALGGLFALRRRHQLYLVMGLSAGVLIAAALLDLLPEALEIAQQDKSVRVETTFLCCALGFLLYYSLDFFVHLGAAGHEERTDGHGEQSETADHHGHHHHHHVSFGSIAALGLTVHSFLDGFAIGGGFQASAKVGWLVAAAVLAHDFGDGVTTVGVVIANLLSFFAGSFLFIGAAHLLPEAEHEGKAPWLYVAVVVGFVFVGVIRHFFST